jgi:hypothetical protein
MSMSKYLLGSACALALACAALPAAAQVQVQVPPPAGPTLDLRLRSEWVRDEAFAEDAHATTLRGRAGWRWAWGGRWSAAVELEGTAHLGGERYSSTANGNLAYPTIPDPDNSELEQAWLAWSPDAATRLAVGRQRLGYDNQRFVGAVGWRQNDQTFDALDVTHKSKRGWSLRYSYLDRAQRVFGADNPNPALARWQLDAHLLSVAHALGPGTLTGYAYFIGNQTLPAGSHRDLGLRYALRREHPQALGWFLAAEATKQDDYADGSAAIDAHYQLLEGGLLWRGNTFKGGRELLSGDGHYGFQTPLATLHTFNGWADRFSSTPVDGLLDRYLGWHRKFGRLETNLVWHDYRSDRGDHDLGSEWNASIGFVPRKHWLVLAKAADYRAGPGGRDLRKTWLSVEYTR